MGPETWAYGREVPAAGSAVIDDLSHIGGHIAHQIAEEGCVIVIRKVIAHSKVCDIRSSDAGLLDIAGIGNHESRATSDDQALPPVAPEFVLGGDGRKPCPIDGVPRGCSEVDIEGLRQFLAL